MKTQTPEIELDAALLGMVAQVSRRSPESEPTFVSPATHKRLVQLGREVIAQDAQTIQDMAQNIKDWAYGEQELSNSFVWRLQQNIGRTALRMKDLIRPYAGPPDEEIGPAGLAGKQASNVLAHAAGLLEAYATELKAGEMIKGKWVDPDEDIVQCYADFMSTANNLRKMAQEGGEA